MALKDNWRGFWSSDNGRNDDSSNYNMFLVPPGSNAVPPDIGTPGGKPGAYRGYDSAFFQADLVSNSYANTSFTLGGGVDLPFGWCCFVQFFSVGVLQTIFSKRISGGTQSAEWEVQVTGTGLLRFTLFGNAAGSISIRLTSTTALTTGVWYFISGDYDGSKTTGGMRLFINAIQVATTPLTTGSYTGMVGSIAPLRIGAAFSTLYIDFLDAALDLIGVRASQFTIAELQELYNGGAGFNPITPALSENWLVYWGSDTLSNEFTGDAPGQVQGVLNDGGTSTPALVSSGGKPDRYHTMDGTNTYNTRFGSGLFAMSFTDGAGNDQAFTATCWVKLNTIAVGASLLSKRDSTFGFSEHAWSLTYSAALGGIVFQMIGDTAATIFIRGLAPIVPVIGQWYHIVATYDGGKAVQGIKIYINGVEQVITGLIQGTYNGMLLTNTIPVYVGLFKGLPSTNTLNGGIDGVGVRKGVTTQAEVTQLYNGGLGLTRDQIFGTIKENWVAWYNFDNLTANDSTASGINLNVLAGTPLVGAAGKIGQAATISPTAYIGRTAPFPYLSFPNTQFSISFWINPSGIASGTQEGIFATGIAANDREWFISHSINIRARFFTIDASNYIGALTTTAPMIDNTWQHIVINKENNSSAANIQIYHNGVQQSGNTLEALGTYAGMIPRNGGLEVGTLVTPATQRASGLYDLIGIRNQLLTQDQILQLYNAGSGNNLFPTKSGTMMMRFAFP